MFTTETNQTNIITGQKVSPDEAYVIFEANKKDIL